MLNFFLKTISMSFDLTSQILTKAFSPAVTKRFGTFELNMRPIADELCTLVEYNDLSFRMSTVCTWPLESPHFTLNKNY